MINSCCMVCLSQGFYCNLAAFLSIVILFSHIFNSDNIKFHTQVIRKKLKRNGIV